jgi:alpha-amylase/alpha-mannosidase (GH57 family)
MDRYVCIHGHFYQPPRENPWLEEVELQDDAYPYHDWNEKITAECYAPNAASRILNSSGKIIDIVNIYSMISFNFGPTLLSWLERHNPDVYQSIIDADRLSMENFSGHGSAIAQAYNHMIMPLANSRDKRTQVVWGIRDFRKRFGRDPEGMWLPEAAVDTETLEMLADAGIVFTILSPRQAAKIKDINGAKWIDVSDSSIDPKMPYLCSLPSGKSINIFFYDGPISQDVAFSSLLKSGEAFAGRMISSFEENGTSSQLVHIATDGETFGHHHRYGDMALAYCLHYIRSNNLAKITNYGEYLAGHTPSHEVEIVENSSWSCVHGVGRWKEDCGCNSGMHKGWSQEWRRPLRAAMDRLRERVIGLYEEDAPVYLKDPWGARDRYIDVILDRTRVNIEDFINTHSKRELSYDEKVYVLKLLEIQRNAMLMYTSCGWFFDDISGIEALQVMQYASKVIQYIEDMNGRYYESEFMKTLEETPSNIYENALRPYRMYVKSNRSDFLRVGAHYSISSFFEEYPEHVKIFCYTAKGRLYDKKETGKFRLAVGTAELSSDITLEEKIISFAVLHLGDHNINGGTRYFVSNEAFIIMQEEIQGAFGKGDIPEVIRLMNKYFEGSFYSAWCLFKDEQKKIMDQILLATYEDIEASYRQIYDNSYTMMNFFHSLGLRIPKSFSVAAEYIINRDIKRIFEAGIDMEKLRKLMEDIRKWSIKIDEAMINYVVSSWIDRNMERLLQKPEDTALLDKIDSTLEVLKPLSLSLNLWNAQNVYFSIGKKFFLSMSEKSRKHDDPAVRWVDGFLKLGKYLQVKI